MAIPSSFFQQKSFSQWYDELMRICLRIYNRYYNAVTLQKKNTFDDTYIRAWEIFNDNFNAGKIKFANDKELGNNNKSRFLLYFLTIFNNLMLAEYQKYKRGKNIEVSFDETLVENIDYVEEDEEDNKTVLFEQLWKAFYKLSERCQQLISASYLGAERMSGEEIAKQFGMKDGIAASKKLGKCRDRLRELANA